MQGDFYIDWGNLGRAKVWMFDSRKNYRWFQSCGGLNPEWLSDPKPRGDGSRRAHIVK